MSREIDGTIRFRKLKETEGFTAEKLIKAINSAYLGDRRKNQFTKKKTFSPSSIGYISNAVCPRYWYLAFDGAEFIESNDAKSVATMSAGTSAHSRIQKALKDSGVLVAEEVEIRLDDPPIRGYVDCLVRIGDDVVVGEIKTTSQEIFALKQASMKPSSNHLYQILIYMKATGKKRGFLLYENRNDLSVLVIPVDFTEKNEKILEDALDWMRLVHNNWKEQKLPTRPYRSQSVKICQQCPVNKVCWEEKPEGVIKLPKMEVTVL